MAEKKKRNAKSSRKRKKLTKKDLQRFKEALIRYRNRLTGDIESIQEEALQPGEQDVSLDHLADHGSETFDYDFNLGLIENVGKTILEIDKALKKIEKGTYGICSGCRKPIPVPRLEFLPWARFCVDCQKKVENGELVVDPLEDDGPDTTERSA